MNLPSLTYRQRNRLLLLVVPLVALIGYWVAIQQTVELYQSNQRLLQQLEEKRHAPNTIRELEKQLQASSRAIANFSSDTLHMEAYLLDRLTYLCRQHRARLVSLPVSQTSRQNGFETITRTIKLQGRFVDLLRVVHGLEYRFQLGRVSSVRFVTEEDRTSRHTELFVYLYLQNLNVQYGEEK